MSEQTPEHAEADATPSVDLDTGSPDLEGSPTDAPVEDPATGNAAVDAVLRSLDRLDELPLEEHPGAYERAHEGLRTALREAREGPADTPGPPSED